MEEQVKDFSNVRVIFREWECVPVLSFYNNENVAIQLYDANDGSPVATASTMIVNPLTNSPLRVEPNAVAIKEWSENQGMTSALKKAGMLGIKYRTYRQGMVNIAVYELLDPTSEENNDIPDLQGTTSFMHYGLKYEYINDNWVTGWVPTQQ